MGNAIFPGTDYNQAGTGYEYYYSDFIKNFIYESTPRSHIIPNIATDSQIHFILNI